jgi:hypothetical protein
MVWLSAPNIPHRPTYAMSEMLLGHWRHASQIQRFQLMWLVENPAVCILRNSRDLEIIATPEVWTFRPRKPKSRKPLVGL